MFSKEVVSEHRPECWGREEFQARGTEGESPK